MELISKHTQTKDIASLARIASFQVHFPNPEIYLVLRVEKVLEGEIQAAFDRCVRVAAAARGGVS